MRMQLGATFATVNGYLQQLTLLDLTFALADVDVTQGTCRPELRLIKHYDKKVMICRKFGCSDVLPASNPPLKSHDVTMTTLFKVGFEHLERPCAHSLAFSGRLVIQ